MLFDLADINIAEVQIKVGLLSKSDVKALKGKDVVDILKSIETSFWRHWTCCTRRLRMVNATCIFCLLKRLFNAMNDFEIYATAG